MSENIIVVAHPEYYDYIHALFLKKGSTCEFTDGGGQLINGVWHGKYVASSELLGPYRSLSHENIELTFDKVENYGDDGYALRDLPNSITINLNITITKEYMKFFDGYSINTSYETWKFNKSPCPDFINQGTNLYNVLEHIDESNTPLTFYRMIHDSKNRDKDDSFLNNSDFDKNISVPKKFNYEFLRYSNTNMWNVKSPSDYEPLIKSISDSIDDIFNDIK